MSGPEQNTDLVAVACVVEASLLLASEWSRVLIDYVYPLLKRLHDLHPFHQFRLAFVTYGAADTRPQPLLSKKYFAPLSQVTKELREEPSRLGIGQTSSGSGRGLSALEGFVAAIELFDVLMASANFNYSQSQSPQKDNRSSVYHLLHIAASPPDNAQRPQHNTLQHLDFVNWDSIPTELRKRKINLSLISLRKIPQFQDLQSSVAGSGAQSPWFNVHTPHVLLLAGFPTPQKTGAKRQTDAIPSEQNTDAKRQKVVSDPVSKTSSASPAPAPARIPQNQHSQASQQPSAPISTPNLTSAQSAHVTPLVPTPTPATASPTSAPTSAPAPAPSLGQAFLKDEVREQVVTSTGHKFGQLMDHLKTLATNIQDLKSRITEAQNAGQSEIQTELEAEKDRKENYERQIKHLLKSHYHKMRLAKESAGMTVGSVLPNGSTEAGPSTQPHPPNVSVTPNQPPTDPAADDHKPGMSDSQMVARFWKSRGGMVSTPDGNPQVGPSQPQSHPTITPESAAQIQHLAEKKSIRPPSLAPPSQPSGTTSQQAGVSPNATNSQATQQPITWVGTLSGTFPKPDGQLTSEVQVHVMGTLTGPMPPEVRKGIHTETWPRNLTLNICKEPVKDATVLSTWFKRHLSRSGLMKFSPSPGAPDVPVNGQRLQVLAKFMAQHGICAYAGWPLPSGKVSRSIFIFAMQGILAGSVFPDGIPDLPGPGNVLDAQPHVEQSKPPLTNGLPLPPGLVAHMQNFEPAQRKQILDRFRHRQMGRQQTQQSHDIPGQALNSLGMAIPQAPYNTVTNLPVASGLHTNLSLPTNAGAYNTVNQEMMQSFMQRNAEGTPSQGTNTGGTNSGQIS